MASEHRLLFPSPEPNIEDDSGCKEADGGQSFTLPSIEAQVVRNPNKGRTWASCRGRGMVIRTGEGPISTDSYASFSPLNGLLLPCGSYSSESQL